MAGGSLRAVAELGLQSGPPSRPPAGLVKVVIPCYRYGRFLDGCVASVLSQEGVDVRVLVIDDCSPDDTAVVAERIAERDERVELRRHTENVGLIATANEGLRWAADSEYLVLLSADDLLVPGALRRAVEVLESHPGVGMVYGQAPYFESNDSLPRLGRSRRGTKVWPGREWIRRRCRAAKNSVCSPEVVVRTSVQRAVGQYSQAHQYTSDLEMWLRIALVSDVAYIKGSAQAFYRKHGGSMSLEAASGAAGVMRDLCERRAVFEDFLDGPGGEVGEVAALRAGLARTLARQALRRACEAYDRGEIGAVPVAELTDFAFDVFPGAGFLPAWWGLRVRRAVGAGRSGWLPPFLATKALHRVRDHLEWRRRRRLGV